MLINNIWHFKLNINNVSFSCMLYVSIQCFSHTFCLCLRLNNYINHKKYVTTNFLNILKPASLHLCSSSSSLTFAVVLQCFLGRLQTMQQQHLSNSLHVILWELGHVKVTIYCMSVYRVSILRHVRSNTFVTNHCIITNDTRKNRCKLRHVPIHLHHSHALKM